MIDFYKQVPQIYTSASRDFQYLSWLINIVLNSVKHNVDMISTLPNKSLDIRLSELLAYTLGFKVRRNYDKEQLLALVSILPQILRCKGTAYALQLAGEALVKSSGVIGDFSLSVDKSQLNIIFPVGSIDITLFMDLLPYIAPAGMPCKISRKTQISKTLNTEYTFADTVYAAWYKDIAIDSTNYNKGQNIFHDEKTGYNQIDSLASIFDPQTNTPVFTNYNLVTVADNTDSNGIPFSELNYGLATNTIIPAMDEPLLQTYPEEQKHSEQSQTTDKTITENGDNLDNE